MNNPKLTTLPKPFSEIKKQEIVRLHLAFELGMYTEEKNQSAVERLNELMKEAVEHRMQSMVAYN